LHSLSGKREARVFLGLEGKEGIRNSSLKDIEKRLEEKKTTIHRLRCAKLSGLGHD
jgi:hypothetical protein